MILDVKLWLVGVNVVELDYCSEGAIIAKETVRDTLNLVKGKAKLLGNL